MRLDGTGTARHDMNVHAAGNLSTLDGAADGRALFSGELTGTGSSILRIERDGSSQVLWTQPSSPALGNPFPGRTSSRVARHDSLIEHLGARCTLTGPGIASRDDWQPLEAAPARAAGGDAVASFEHTIPEHPVRIPEPFDRPDWILEVKHDAVCVVAWLTVS